MRLMDMGKVGSWIFMLGGLVFGGNVLAQHNYCAKTVDPANYCGNSFIKGVEVSNVLTNDGLCDRDAGNVALEDGYSDYSDFVVYLDPQVPTEVLVSIDGNVFDVGTIWLDWNNDGVWTEDELTVLTGEGFAVNIIGGVITPPPGAVVDQVIEGGMRISHTFLVHETEPCGVQQFGEVEDFSFIVTTDAPPSGGSGTNNYCYAAPAQACNFQYVLALDIDGNIIQNDLECDRDNITGAGPIDGYSDYSDLVLELDASGVHQISLTVDGNVLDATATNIYFDFDNSGTWDETEQFPLTGESTLEQLLTGFVVVPQGAVAGRIIEGGVRVIHDFLGPQTDACTGPTGSGEVEDYSFLIIDPTLVTCPDLLFPANMQEDVCTNTLFTWSEIDSAVTYEFTLRDSVSKDTLDFVLVNDTSFFSSNLSANDTLEWRVVAIDKDGRRSLRCGYQSLYSAPILNPSVSFADPTDTLCFGDSLVLQPTIVSGGTIIVNWSPSANLSDATDANSTLYANTVGDGVLKIEVEDEYNCVDSALFALNTKALPQATSLSRNAEELCAGDSLIIDFETDADAFNFLTQDANGSVQSEATPIKEEATNYYFAEVDTNLIYSIAMELEGCVDTVLVDTVLFQQELDPAVVELINPLTTGPCEGNDYDIVISNYTDVEWFNGSTNDTITISATTDVSVVYTFGACSAQFDSVFTIHPKPQKPIFSFSGNINTLCEGDTAEFTVVGVNQYTWYDGNRSDLTRAYYEDIALYVIGENEFGCVRSSDTLDILFQEAPTSPVLVVSGLEDPLCEGDLVDITTQLDRDMIWSNGSQGDAISVGESGAYFASYTEGACTVYSDTVNLDFGIVPVQPTISLISGSGQDSLLASTAGAMYSWSKDGNALPQTVQQIAEQGVGSYEVFVVGENGCVSELSESFMYTGIGIEEFAGFEILKQTYQDNWLLTFGVEVDEVIVSNMLGQQTQKMNSVKVVSVPRDGKYVVHIRHKNRLSSVKLF